MSKSPDAFRTISEVAEWLGVQAHVLRFWESKFTQVKPVKRAGGRRYYRPADMLLLGGIKKLLHDDGLPIKEVQALLREHGAAHVSGFSHSLDGSAEERPETVPPADKVGDDWQSSLELSHDAAAQDPAEGSNVVGFPPVSTADAADAQPDSGPDSVPVSTAKPQFQMDLAPPDADTGAKAGAEQPVSGLGDAAAAEPAADLAPASAPAPDAPEPPAPEAPAPLSGSDAPEAAESLDLPAAEDALAEESREEIPQAQPTAESSAPVPPAQDLSADVPAAEDSAPSAATEISATASDAEPAAPAMDGLAEIPAAPEPPQTGAETAPLTTPAPAEDQTAAEAPDLPQAPDLPLDQPPAAQEAVPPASEAAAFDPASHEPGTPAPDTDEAQPATADIPAAVPDLPPAAAIEEPQEFVWETDSATADPEPASEPSAAPEDPETASAPAAGPASDSSAAPLDEPAAAEEQAFLDAAAPILAAEPEDAAESAAEQAFEAGPEPIADTAPAAETAPAADTGHSQTVEPAKEPEAFAEDGPAADRAAPAAIDPALDTVPDPDPAEDTLVAAAGLQPEEPLDFSMAPSEAAAAPEAGPDPVSKADPAASFPPHDLDEAARQVDALEFSSGFDPAAEVAQDSPAATETPAPQDVATETTAPGAPIQPPAQPPVPQPGVLAHLAAIRSLPPHALGEIAACAEELRAFIASRH
ncbi:MerR family transcriptional regulator [Leisingera sp. F5]|uniref:MerR family transcriptional regulator n=1 Tax=Leisingera sp. F5 TaxID=1813816 RepID=UPI000AD932F6|nr:MerR family transcriptional regulator [Leisingera sp. F5]